MGLDQGPPLRQRADALIKATGAVYHAPKPARYPRKGLMPGSGFPRPTESCEAAGSFIGDYIQHCK